MYLTRCFERQIGIITRKTAVVRNIGLENNDKIKLCRKCLDRPSFRSFRRRIDEIMKNVFICKKIDPRIARYFSAEVEKEEIVFKNYEI